MRWSMFMERNEEAPFFDTLLWWTIKHSSMLFKSCITPFFSPASSLPPTSYLPNLLSSDVSTHFSGYQSCPCGATDSFSYQVPNHPIVDWRSSLPMRKKGQDSCFFANANINNQIFENLKQQIDLFIKQVSKSNQEGIQYCWRISESPTIASFAGK